MSNIEELIQQQIVTIYDSFTKLEARRKQYEYYRGRLLDFKPLKK